MILMISEETRTESPVKSPWISQKAQSTARFALIQAVLEVIGNIEEKYPQLIKLKNDIHIAAAQILGNLPGTITNRPIITKRCSKPADQAILDLGQSNGEITNSLSNLRNELCMHITLILNKNYIDRIISKIKTYQEIHKPTRWGIGSIRGFGGKIGAKELVTFQHFWRNNIEAEGDIFFREQMLPRLSQEWQEKFDPVAKCPYEWSEMANKQIGKLLESLKQKKDPAKERWSIEMVKSWKDKNGANIGKYFHEYWKKRYGNEAEQEFRLQILPHISADWSQKFTENGIVRAARLYDWGGLSIAETVSILTSLKPHRDPETTRWGFGSIEKWGGEREKRAGASFYKFWKSAHGHEAEKKFRDTYLPHFPQKWRETYCSRRYVISFTKSSTESQKAAAEENDLDKLVELAQSGNQDAFKKALCIAMQFMENRFPRDVIPSYRIERHIHTHRSALGEFKGNLIISTAKFLKQERWRNTSMEKFPRLHDQGFGVNDIEHAEDNFIKNLEPSKAVSGEYLDALEELQLSPEACEKLQKLIESGATLDEAINGENKEIASTAKKVKAALERNAIQPILHIVAGENALNNEYMESDQKEEVLAA